MSNQARISAAIEKLERLKAESNGDLIVTLHRTIDAQLELLRLAQKYGELDAGSGSRFIAGAVKLADAIVGT